MNKTLYLSGITIVADNLSPNAVTRRYEQSYPYWSDNGTEILSCTYQLLTHPSFCGPIANSYNIIAFRQRGVQCNDQCRRRAVNTVNNPSTLPINVNYPDVFCLFVKHILSFLQRNIVYTYIHMHNTHNLYTILRARIFQTDSNFDSWGVGPFNDPSLQRNWQQELWRSQKRNHANMLACASFSSWPSNAKLASANKVSAV